MLEAIDEDMVCGGARVETTWPTAMLRALPVMNAPMADKGIKWVHARDGKSTNQGEE